MGQSPKGEDVNTTGAGIPLLNGPTEFGSRYPVPTQFTVDGKKIAKENSLLFCVRGSTTGRMNWADQKYAIGRGLASINHIEGSEYQVFAKAVIEYKLPALLVSATGSTFPNVSRDQLTGLKINLPPLPEQKAIAHVLGALDDKIELNRQMNQTLEEMAQALFKSWFVDFDPVIDNALAAGNPIPEPLQVRAEKRKKLLEQSRRDASSPPVLGGVPRSAWRGGPSTPNQENPEYKETQVAPSPPNTTNLALNNLPHLKTFRKVLRNNMTPAEASLWKVLKGKQLAGRKFRRQHSVGNYILDFYCPSERLAVELDGQGHYEEEQLVYDRERDLFLEHFGIKVLRFENKWVYENTAGLIQAIQDAFGWKERFMEKNRNHPAFQAPLLQKEGNTTSLNNHPDSVRDDASSPPNLGGVDREAGRGGISPHNNTTPESSGVNHDFNHLFPSSFTYSETLGKWIPEGWEVKKISSSCARVTNGGTPSRKREDYWGGIIPWLASGEVRQSLILDTKERITESGLIGSSAKLVPAKSTVIAMYGATAGQVGFTAIETTTNQAICSLIPSLGFTYFNHFAMLINVKLLENSARGSAQQNISKGIIEELQVLYPKSGVRKEFEKYVESTFDKRVSNEKQTQSLTQLRDTILPKLISGKLRLPEDFVERFEGEES